MAKNKAIVAFAFGKPENISPNRLIADLAFKSALEMNALVYTQDDIEINPGVEVKYVDQKKDNPPSTLEIAKQAVKWGREDGIDELIVFAAPPHIKRCIRDVEKMVQKYGADIKISKSSIIPDQISHLWFSKNSKQLRTRSKIVWWLRETVISLLPFPVYKKIAT